MSRVYARVPSPGKMKEKMIRLRLCLALPLFIKKSSFCQYFYTLHCRVWLVLINVASSHPRYRSLSKFLADLTANMIPNCILHANTNLHLSLIVIWKYGWASGWGKPRKCLRNMPLTLIWQGDSDFWRRKIRTFHSILDLNKDGVISFDDFKLLAKGFVDLGHLSEKHTQEFYVVIQVRRTLSRL